MTKEEILKQCVLYKGGSVSPYKNETHETQIWLAEKFCYENNEIVTSDSGDSSSMYSWIESYIGKWNPWLYQDVMETYKKLKNGK